MFATFHVCGMMFLFNDMLYVLVSPGDRIWLMYLMLTLSDTVELLFLLCFIASWTCVVVSIIMDVCSLCGFSYMRLFVLCVLCLTVGELLVECVCQMSGGGR